jgi:hypothetical protein
MIPDCTPKSRYVSKSTFLSLRVVRWYTYIHSCALQKERQSAGCLPSGYVTIKGLGKNGYASFRCKHNTILCQPLQLFMEDASVQCSFSWRVYPTSAGSSWNFYPEQCPERLVVAQLVKKLPRTCGIPRFIVSRSQQIGCSPCPEPDEPTPPHIILFPLVHVLLFHLRLNILSGSFLQKRT